MEVESRKKALRYFFSKVVDPLGYKFTPDEDIADFLLEQEVGLERKFGSPFCPCQGRTQNHEENMKIVCPCIPFHRELRLYEVLLVQAIRSQRRDRP